MEETNVLDIFKEPQVEAAILFPPPLHPLRKRMCNIEFLVKAFETQAEIL